MSVVAARGMVAQVVAAVIIIARLRVFGLKSIRTLMAGGSRPHVRATCVPLPEGSLVEGGRHGGAIHAELSVVAARGMVAQVVAAVIILARLRVFGLKSMRRLMAAGSRPHVRATCVPLPEGSLVEGGGMAAPSMRSCRWWQQEAW